MSRWSQNGHRQVGPETFDDTLVEALVAGRYEGDAPDLVAVSRFVEKVRALADGPAPPPSAALARVLGNSLPASDAARPTTGRRWLLPPPAVAAAVAAVLVAAVVAAGSARLLPGPTQDVVANIVRTVTPFGFPEQREPEPGSATTPGSRKVRPSDDPGTPSRVDSSPPGAGQPGTNGRETVGPDGADGRSQPNGLDAAPRPGTPPVPRAAPPVPASGGGSSDGVATGPAPPAPPEPPDFKADLSGTTGTPPAGDPDGRGTAIIDAKPGRDELCLTLVVSDTAPVTAAHVHVGTIGVSGPVVAAFGESAAGPSGECVAVPDQLIGEIRKEPGKYYVDVHTAEFPDEALRGQLAP